MQPVEEEEPDVELPGATPEVHVGEPFGTTDYPELAKATKEVEDRLVMTMSFLCITLSFG